MLINNYFNESGTECFIYDSRVEAIIANDKFLRLNKIEADKTQQDTNYVQKFKQAGYQKIMEKIK